MRARGIIATFLIASMILFASCKKCGVAPKINFVSKKKRLIGKWEEVHDGTLGQPQQGVWGKSNIIEFSANGEYSATLIESRPNSTFDTTVYYGTWFFADGNVFIQSSNRIRRGATSTLKAEFYKIYRVTSKLLCISVYQYQEEDGERKFNRIE